MFELSDVIICIKDYESLKAGNRYSIKGMGDLSMSSSKSGQGYMIEDEFYGMQSGRKDWWNLPYDKRVKWYYFTTAEMNEYFTSKDVLFLRKKKIKKILSKLKN